MTTKISTTIPCGIGAISVNCAVIEHVFLLCLFVSVCASNNIGDTNRLSVVDIGYTWNQLAIWRNGLNWAITNQFICWILDNFCFFSVLNKPKSQLFCYLMHKRTQNYKETDINCTHYVLRIVYREFLYFAVFVSCYYRWTLFGLIRLICECTLDLNK